MYVNRAKNLVPFIGKKVIPIFEILVITLVSQECLINTCISYHTLLICPFNDFSPQAKQKAIMKKKIPTYYFFSTEYFMKIVDCNNFYEETLLLLLLQLCLYVSVCACGLFYKNYFANITS